MLIHHAELIAELLTNAGWNDDADELLSDIEGSEGRTTAVAKAREVISLIRDINPLLKTHVKINTKQIQEYINDNSGE